jgi:hypothetical protein
MHRQLILRLVLTRSWFEGFEGFVLLLQLDDQIIQT